MHRGASRFVAAVHTKIMRGPDRYEAEDTPGLYFLGTLAHVRDYRKSSGGFVHGLRYTARALHKWLEQKNHGVPWPRTEVAMVAGGEGQSLLQKLTDRMDTSSGLYQMFGVFGDVAILPSVRKRSKNSATATAQVRLCHLWHASSPSETF